VHEPVDVSVFVAPNDKNDTIELKEQVSTSTAVKEVAIRYLVSIRCIQEKSCLVECDASSILDRVTVDASGQGRERL